MVLRSNPDWKWLQGASGEPVIGRGADIRPLGIPWLIGIFPKLLTCWDRGLSQSNCVTTGSMCNQHNENSYVWRPLWSFHTHCLGISIPRAPFLTLVRASGKNLPPSHKRTIEGAVSQLENIHGTFSTCFFPLLQNSMSFHLNFHSTKEGHHFDKHLQVGLKAGQSLVH